MYSKLFDELTRSITGNAIPGGCYLGSPTLHKRDMLPEFEHLHWDGFDIALIPLPDVKNKFLQDRTQDKIGWVLVWC